MAEQAPLIEMTTEIVAAYVAKNAIPAADLPALIQNVHAALEQSGTAVGAPAPLEPAVSIRKSVTPDYLICLEDGLKFKSLRRHLQSKYDMSPEDYRAKWGLPADYPMVAPNYARQRSELAKKIGLGRKAGGRKRK